MENSRDTLIASFADGKTPTGSQFRLLIESIMSRRDDGMDKNTDSSLKVMAGKDANAPVLSLCPKGVLDAQWVLSLKALDLEGKVVGEGLQFGQGDKPNNPVMFLDKTTGNIGLGTNVPAAQLEVQRELNGENSAVVNNTSEGPAAFSIARLRTLGGDGVIFKNSVNRAADGGANAMTVRNDAGDLRLHSAAGKGNVVLKAGTGFVGINNPAPLAPLDVDGDITLNGHNLYFPAPDVSVANTASPGIFWHGANNGVGAYSYAIYKTDGPWTGNYQQLRVNWDTGIQLSAGTGVGTGYGKSYVDVTTGKGLMVSSGNLGVGTANPLGKAHVAMAAFDGDAALAPAWSNNQFVVGLDANGGGIGMGYHPVKNTSYLLSAQPGVGFKDLVIKANTTIISNGTTESMRVQPDGRVGIGTNAPSGLLQMRKDANAGTTSILTNSSAGVDSFVGRAWQTDSSAGWLFKNSSTRVADGGVNTMTLRNDKGDLRLQSEGGKGLLVRAVDGNVSIGGTNPLAPLSITSGAGKEDTPDGTMHITNDCILFGGNNGPGKEAQSAQISAGKHVANALCIVGMTVGNNAAERRIDIWSNNGLNMREGGIGFGTNGNVPAPISIYNGGKWQSPDAGMHITNDSIIFGGANNGQEINSGQINAGRHIPNSLNILGLTTGANWATRRVHMWAEGGFQVFGNVGIGTQTAQHKLHINGGNIAITASEDPNAQNAAGHSNLGSLTFYGHNRPTGDDSARIVCGSTNWDDHGYLGFYTSNDGGPSVERMRIAQDGSINIGGAIGSPQLFHARRDVNGNVHNITQNGSNGTDAYTLVGMQTDNSYGFMFKNSSMRAADGGVNTMTVRNDKGDLRLQAEGGVGLHVKAATGRVGVLTANPAGKLHVVVNPSDGNVGDWGDGQFLVGPDGGTRGNGIGMSWSGEVGYVSALAPSVGWRDLNFRTRNTLFTYGGAQEVMRVDGPNSRVGINTNAPQASLSLGGGGKEEWPDGVMHITNDSILFGGNNGAGRDAYSATITAGKHQANSLCIVGMTGTNNAAERRMDIWSENGLNMRAGGIGFGTNGNVPAPLSIYTGGKWQTPDGGMHITNGAIMFGGNNNARDTASCSISAGNYAANTMCIVGMSSGASAADRKVRVWAEGGMTVHGTMGVNVDAGQFPIHIGNAVGYQIPGYSYLNRWTTGTANGGAWAGVSLWAADRIVASEFNAVSDIRTKANIQPVVGKDELALLNKIETCTYQYKDTHARGSEMRKGVIAQQIREIYPEAVGTHTEYVPDIFSEPAKVELDEEGKLSLTMAEPHGLRTGDKVKVYSNHGFAAKEVKVKNKKTFSLNDWEHATEGMFVYGKEVTDFMVVDYDRLFTTCISATQELSRQVEALQAANAELVAANTHMQSEIEAIKLALSNLK